MPHMRSHVPATLSLCSSIGFSAGNALVDDEKNDDDWCRQSIPILVYAWAGGIIDVFSCGLLTKAYPLEKIQQEIDHDIDSAILLELVENGSLDVLWEILSNVADEKTNSTIDEIAGIQQADMWKLAYKEYRSFVTTKKSAQQKEGSELKMPTFDELLHDSSLRNVRSILQSFGNDE